MAEFLPAFEKMLLDEGGYTLHTVQGDSGGQTYAGIARNAHPGWSGWAIIDEGSTPPADQVRAFYKAKFWEPMQGDGINSQRIAESVFSFYVNAGTPAIKLAQIVIGVTPDGVIGPRTLAVLNEADEDKFVMAYALAKIARYRDIVTRDRTQMKFMLGWINRTLKGLA
jgi:lysozyme family protein